jgi:lipoate-protein ligase B
MDPSLYSAPEFSPLPLEVRFLGRSSYDKVWDLQRELQKERIKGDIPDTLLVCEHDPCLTFGKSSGGRQNLRVSEKELQLRGVSVFEVERGGDITYHGPGQAVFYPIIDLKTRRRDVHWYMRSLEEIIINCLSDFSLESGRVEGRTGVWVPESKLSEQEAKVASIGVRISRWVTMHGFSVNVSDCSEGFNLIYPCGITDRKTSSLEQELGDFSPSLSEVSLQMVHHFEQFMSFKGRRHAESL